MTCVPRRARARRTRSSAKSRPRKRPGGAMVATAAGTWAGGTVAGAGRTGTTGATAGTTGATAGITSGTTGKRRRDSRDATVAAGAKSVDRGGRRPADALLQYQLQLLLPPRPRREERHVAVHGA